MAEAARVGGGPQPASGSGRSSARPGARFRVGIDLGTTHTVVAYAPVAAAAGDAAPRIFPIEQLVAAGEVAALALLPSLRYHPADGEVAAGELALPWAHAGGAPEVVGSLARRLGAQVPGRLVASAKSWLSHAAVDRLAPILPWGAPDRVPKVSPVAASASYLAHVRAAWNHHHPDAPLEAQELVLTVPASFDEAARALTRTAARQAGLAELRLLEEPQAALYDWLFRHRTMLAEALGGARMVLVCDIGGGTTDLSLVRATLQNGEPMLERVAVGRHLMLGGDNIDLALAHLAEGRLGEARLAPAEWTQLAERCRAVKERLLGADAPEHATVTLLGGGARLVGGARSADLGRDEVLRLVLDGFFPPVPADAQPRSARGAGLVSFGLPYASDPAVTRHLAEFLRRQGVLPDALLLNGGVFRAPAIAERLHEVLAGWRGGPVRRLENDAPDVAVARGAVAYAMARDGLAPRIGSGAARSVFLKLDGEGGGAPADGPRGVCLLPRGSEEGRELRLQGRRFVLRTGAPVRFHLLTTDDAAPPAGSVVDLSGPQVQPLPPLATVVAAPEGSAARDIEVELAATLTEVGTLQVDCIAAAPPPRRWTLEFQLLGADEGLPEPAGLPPRFEQAVEAIERVYGARIRDVGPKPVKQLRVQLESLLGSRDRWSTPVLRALFDALMQRARSRRRSADHERLWLSLAGWCLRPGFGDPLDAWRIAQLWPLYELGVQHGQDAQVCAEWWTLWRRVAGGLDAEAQRRLLDDFALGLRGEEAGIRERPPHFVRGGRDDLVRLGASLERIAAEHKAEIGDWLVARLDAPADGPRDHDPYTPWAIGRLGARVPFYGSAHDVVAPEKAVAWLEVLLRYDWKRYEGVAAAAASLARASGDRARDLPQPWRDQVVARLEAMRAPPAWADRVREVVALDDAGARGAFGEALPPGLRLVAG